MNIKESLEKLNQQIKEINKQIVYVKNLCPHEHVKDQEYYDYDDKYYMITCLDCGRIIYDGDYANYKSYKNKKGD